MHPQHNPIALRLDEMCKVWQKEVKPETVLIRWMLKPDESRMYEAFCRLEASAHGKLQELFVFFYTPFEDAVNFSKQIMQHFLDEIKSNSKAKDSLVKSGIDINAWNYSKYERLLADERYINYDQLLVEMLQSYRGINIKEDAPLVLGLLPKGIKSLTAFAKWLQQVMQQASAPFFRILIFDSIESNYWGPVFENYNDRSVTLIHDLRMDAAVQQIATAGDSLKPEVQFRKCMYEMANAAEKNDLQRLHLAGKKGVDIGIKSGNKSLLATAYITYAGMLFTFKEHSAIHSLLDTGTKVCQAQIATGDKSIRPLFLQFYGFKGAAYQQQKDTRKAFECFMSQGQKAFDYKLFSESISGYYKAYLLAQFKNRLQEKIGALDAALQNTLYLHDEEIKSNEYPFVAYEYAMLVENNIDGADEQKNSLACNRMEKVFGTDWKNKVEAMKQNHGQKRVRMAEAETINIRA